MEDNTKITNIENSINNLKDDLRDIKTDYLKKDDINYVKYQNKVDLLEDNVTCIKTTLKNLEKQTTKNNDIVEQLNTTSTKLTTLLDNYSFTQKEIKQDVKELKEKFNGLNLDTSKNTDFRMNWKQIGLAVGISLIISVLTLFLGVSIGSQYKPNTTNTTKTTSFNSTQNEYIL